MNTNQNKEVIVALLLNIKLKYNLTQKQIGKMLNMTQPRVSLLLNLNLRSFKIDLFLEVLEGIGIVLELKFNNDTLMSSINTDKAILYKKITEARKVHPNKRNINHCKESI